MTYHTIVVYKKCVILFIYVYFYDIWLVMDYFWTLMQISWMILSSRHLIDRRALPWRSRNYWKIAGNGQTTTHLLSNMATFSKRERMCLLLQKPLQATNPWPAIRAPDTSESQGESCDFGISNLLDYLLGPASAIATLRSCGPNVKLQYAMKLSKSCWLHFFIRYFTALHWLMSGKRPDVQVPKKERSWVGATWQLLQFPCGQWVWMDLNHLTVLPAWISYLKLSAHPNLIYYVAMTCRPYGGDVWRWSQRKKEVRKKLCNIESRSNSRWMYWAVLLWSLWEQGPGQFGRNCRAQNDSIHVMKVQGSLREQSTCDPHESFGRGAIPPFNKKDP